MTGDAAELLLPAPTDAPEGRLRLTRQATVEQVRVLRQAALAFAEHAGVAEPGDVALAVSEAVTNVVLHAYAHCVPGPVHLEAGVDGDRLVVVVRDEGPGLVPRPDSPGLGLGLPTIAQLVEELDIGDGDGDGLGVRVRMAFPLAQAL